MKRRYEEVDVMAMNILEDGDQPLIKRDNWEENEECQKSIGGRYLAQMPRSWVSKS